VTPPRPVDAALTGRALRRLSPALEVAFRSRVERERADEALLARHDADPALAPAILSVRPDPGSPVPGRLERDVGLVSAALEAGRRAAHAVLAVA
jgi:hypothetical protein